MGSKTAALPESRRKAEAEARTQCDSAPRGQVRAGEGPWSSPHEEAASVWTSPSLHL